MHEKRETYHYLNGQLWHRACYLCWRMKLRFPINSMTLLCEDDEQYPQQQMQLIHVLYNEHNIINTQKKMYTKCKKITIRIIYRQISHTWYPVSLFWSSEIIKHCCPYVRYALRDTYIIIKSFISYRRIVSTHESDDTVWISYKSYRIVKLYVSYDT